MVRRTLDPVYDEDFTFYGVHFNQLPVRSAVREERVAHQMRGKAVTKPPLLLNIRLTGGGSPIQSLEFINNLTSESVLHYSDHTNQKDMKH